ncbi:Aste57867_20604 [Aphanomyces stellatus]|uniref:Vacuolar ATPase assembly protein VMA22 n=1 Tax=Aphanomyces stellatus TaxID=120398 RepID=A0A485LHC8_9STRA|nr:hypothetical protein As57867_020536 [Aphanomyces stellatus]VFT97284.1 Aste57867_20604 [Aphanomyces stellatus]
MPTDEDTLLLASVDAAAQYSRATLEASDLLKGAFFKLSIAKRSVATDVLSSSSFRETFDATCGVTSDGNTFNLRKDWDKEGEDLKQEKREPEETSSTTDNLRNRKQKTPTPSPSEPPTSTTTSSESILPTPIFWFAPLPSQELRAAQQLFIKALDRYVEAATSARRLHAAITDVHHLSTTSSSSLE